MIRIPRPPSRFKNQAGSGCLRLDAALFRRLRTYGAGRLIVLAPQRIWGLTGFFASSRPTTLKTIAVTETTVPTMPSTKPTIRNALPLFMCANSFPQDGRRCAAYRCCRYQYTIFFTRLQEIPVFCANRRICAFCI